MIHIHKVFNPELVTTEFLHVVAFYSVAFLLISGMKFLRYLYL
jgi:hypothetical protein